MLREHRNFRKYHMLFLYIIYLDIANITNVNRLAVTKPERKIV